MSDAQDYLENLPKEEPSLSDLKNTAHQKLRDAQKAWHDYWTACEVGPDRTRGAEVYTELMQVIRRT